MSLKIYAAAAALAAVGAAEAAEDAEADACYGPGDVAGAVIGTFIATMALTVAALFIYKWYWRSRKGKHLVLVTDAENPNDQYAFDNPCFREATPVKHGIQDEKAASKLDKNRWLGWSPLHSFASHKNEKLTSLDDSYVNDSHMKVVSLKGHDFTGLGFNICGNMRDGIFVKDVLHRGPAFESGCINSGDRIDSVCISFRNMVFEDALTILSYASPYEVQVQVENASHSRPSTLIRSKRESNAVSSVDRIRHPKYNRSQSISHLTEIGKGNNKWYNHQPILSPCDKNKINQSLNKSDGHGGGQNDYPTLKISAVNDSKKDGSKLVKTTAPKSSPKNIKTNPNAMEKKSLDVVGHREQSSGYRNEDDDGGRMQKFGIKVLPISINPKMGIQSVTGGKKMKNKSPEEAKTLNVQSVKAEEVREPSKVDETDGGNVKTLISKGLHTLKERINQNSLGRKKNKEQQDDDGACNEVKTHSNGSDRHEQTEGDVTGSVPVPKARSSVSSSHTGIEPASVPEEVTRAGDVARNNRKSLVDTHESASRRSTAASLVEESKNKNFKNDIEKMEDHSGSDTSSENGSPRGEADEAKRPKRSKGKAPAPPQALGRDAGIGFAPAEVNAITDASDIVRDDSNIFEPTEKKPMGRPSGRLVNDPTVGGDRNIVDAYDSDSDNEMGDHPRREKRNGTKIELSATQVTIHHSPTSDASNDDEIETSRKAASLGDLSKLDSDHTLSVVLERAVSLDLADGTSQCGKKRKAPLPPPEEFPTVFDEIGYRKEPRLETSLGLNTFQRRLKKSSDFGTLEDAIQDGPKSLEIELKKTAPLDVLEANHSNIQEFSSWLEDCRKQKDREDDPPVPATSRSLVNINVSDDPSAIDGDIPECGATNKNVTFSVNGKNFCSEDQPQESNSYTVVVISQPNSLEPIISEGVSLNLAGEGEDTPKEGDATEASGEGSSVNVNVSSDTDYDREADDIPPKLPSSPIPVISKTTLSSPLSKSLTYVTEIKVSTSDDASPDASRDRNNKDNFTLNIPSRTISDDGSVAEAAPASTPAKSVNLDARGGDGHRRFSQRTNPTEEINHSNESITHEAAKRGNDYSFESRIPIRTMKSETGQRVLATIQSLAAKESPPKTPEVEYAKRVASLFSSGSSGPRPAKPKGENEAPGFYLSAAPKKPATARKVPPTVPPRKVDASVGKSTVTVAVSGKAPKDNAIGSDSPSDRSIVTFSSFSPRPSHDEPRSLPKIVNWKENAKDMSGVNGGHVQVQSGVMNLPVKTSATKIVFETKDLSREEL